MSATEADDGWIAEAMELAQRRAPLLTDAQVHDLADDLYKACADFHSPYEAVSRFFAAMPGGWNVKHVTAGV